MSTTTELVREKIRADARDREESLRAGENATRRLAEHFTPVRDALTELHRDGVQIVINGKAQVFPEVTGSSCSLEMSGSANFPHVLYSDGGRYILMDTRTTRYYDDPQKAVEAFIDALLPYFTRWSEKQTDKVDER